jgi:hypothetical protein
MTAAANPTTIAPRKKLCGGAVPILKWAITMPSRPPPIIDTKTATAKVRNARRARRVRRIAYSAALARFDAGLFVCA